MASIYVEEDDLIQNGGDTFSTLTRRATELLALPRVNPVVGHTIEPQLSAAIKPTEPAAILRGSFDHYSSYFLTENVEDLHQAVGIIREHINVFSPKFSGIVLAHWGRILLRNFQHSRESKGLTEATEKFEGALQLLTNDSPLRQRCLEFLNISRLERNGSLDGLQELHPHDACSQSGPSLETLYQNLNEDDEVHAYFERKADELESRYVSGMRMEDLESAIKLGRQGMRYFSSNRIRRAESLIRLSSWLTWRFDRQNNLDDINEAVDCSFVSLELMSPEAAHFAHWQSVASRACMRRFEALGRREDLQNGVDFAKFAVEALQVRDPDLTHTPKFAIHLDSLAWAMARRYQTTGDVSDLDAAIEHSGRAVDFTVNAAELPALLNNLSVHLGLRYRRNGRSEDLRDAVATLQRAVNLLPPEDPNLIEYLANLSSYESILSSVLQDEEYARRAFQHIRQAWIIRNGDPGFKCQVQHVLCNVTVKLHLDKPENLDEVIDLARISTSVTNDPSAITSYVLLCSCLYRKWQSTQRLEDIDEAIRTAQQMKALADAISELTDRSVLAQVYLGKFLHARYLITGDNKDCKEAVAILLKALRTSIGTPYFRMEAGHLAISILCEMADWHSAHQLLKEVIDLFLLLNGRSQVWSMKQYWMTQFSHRIAAYAAIALEAGSTVLNVINVLETCRGLIWGNLIDKRVDLDDLMEVAPGKANLLEMLQTEITSETMIDPRASEDMNARVKQTARKIEAEKEIRECLEDIRRIKGFHRFLLGPLEEELKAAAAWGPIVVVNVTDLRSDAIIITKDALDLLPLPDLKCEKVHGYAVSELTDFSFGDSGPKNVKFRELQAWLWDNCVQLIFQKLETLGYGPEKFRMWWVCVGRANSLPFHAAGKYTGKSSENALSRAISSYTPSLKLLIHGQRKLKDNPRMLDLERLTIKQQTQKINPRLTVIAMPSTPGKSKLHGVQREANVIQEIVADVFSTQILVQPSAKDTMFSMAESEIAHFACHAAAILPDVSESHLLLQAASLDSSNAVVDELKVKDVAAADLNHGKLAVLSACSTAQNNEENLWDEGIHLVAAFHVAGYSHVVGNLWIADDEMSLELMNGFYKHLVEAGDLGHGEHVARALNEASLSLAKKYAKQPLSWAQFVHMGI